MWKELLFYFLRKCFDCNLGNIFSTVIYPQNRGNSIRLIISFRLYCVYVVDDVIVGGRLLCQNRRRKVMGFYRCLPGRKTKTFCRLAESIYFVIWIFRILTLSFPFAWLQVKIWFQNHRYKCKRQAKEKAMAEQNQHNQVRE